MTPTPTTRTGPNPTFSRSLRFYARHRTPTGETGAYLGERPGASFT